ncbi:MAG: dihydrofolate reductase [Firmicutes bacterium]|nr:dihydrofolate reductase [Bacillota bacterium]
MRIENLTILAAIGRNRELGKANDLCWRIREDLINFKNLTMGHYILMGENTYFSLPPKGLPGRKYLVMSPTLELDNGEVFRNLEEFLEFAKSTDEEIFVCGGGQIYKLLMPYCSKMILTEIDDIDSEATVFFPEWGSEWIVSESKDFVDNGLTYSRVVYII